MTFNKFNEKDNKETTGKVKNNSVLFASFFLCANNNLSTFA